MVPRINAWGVQKADNQIWPTTCDNRCDDGASEIISAS